MPQDPPDRSQPTPAMSAAARARILQELASVASGNAGDQWDAFAARLADAWSRLSTQTIRSADAGLCASGAAHLQANQAMFCRYAALGFSSLLQKEIRAFECSDASRFGQDVSDLSLVTFDEMENKVLIGNISQALELDHTELLGALNLRLAHLLWREEISVAQNPFRPAIFVQAVYEAWCKLDPAVATHGLFLRLLRPDAFLPLAPIFQALNDTLIAQRILPSLVVTYRARHAERKRSSSINAGRRGLPLYHKLQKWLAGAEPHGETNDNDLQDPAGEPRERFLSGSARKIESELSGYLSGLQQRRGGPYPFSGSDSGADSANVLRQVRDQAPHGSLTPVDEKTIELLATIFDFVFAEASIPPAMRGLIGRLQIPLLKTALLDPDFLFQEDHPARRLVETLAQSGLAWDPEQGRDDPLYEMIERIVARVDLEFVQQIELFSNVVAELESFLSEEERLSEAMLAAPVAEAMRQERMQHAYSLAERDVAARIETGEVAGFVEIFLERQWTSVLTLAHSVSDSKPEALEKALRTMDDLIWSLKPKTTPEERKELLGKLPAMLSMINAWLNTIRWDEPERMQFFSSLAERHAAVVRAPLEVSARRQVEMAVNAAQKASERRFSAREKELGETPVDQFVLMVEAIEWGDWVEFVRVDATTVKFKLAWISPRRSRYIFTSRHGADAFSYTAEELARAFRDQEATLVPSASVIDRALMAALDQIKP